MTTEQKLERLKNYHTRYEIAAERGDGHRLLIGYTPRKGRRGMYSMLQQRLDGGSLEHVLGTLELNWGKRAADGCAMGDWRIFFTGRTQRDAILAGELPFICDVQAATVAGGAS